MGEEPRKYDLEDRLVKFAIMILEVCDLLPNTKAANKFRTSAIEKWNGSSFNVW